MFNNESDKTIIPYVDKKKDPLVLRAGSLTLELHYTLEVKTSTMQSAGAALTVVLYLLDLL